MVTAIAMKALRAPVRVVGRTFESVARHAGGVAILIWQIGGAILRGRVSFREVVAQAYSMGAQSIPLVCVTGMLSGLVTSQQGGYQF
jgi:phospholipid/cholesterol/gamma-HCH transport system permease protein